MQDLSVLISGIEFKLRKLLEQENQLRLSNAQLAEENQKLREIVENQKNTIKEIEEKYKVLKITKSLNDGSNSFDQKIKINEMLREVEKCIGLLNK
ncbi:MAG: hypothetical protein NTZ33_05825 [Bacteroidetes bacterium]|nr:hypothetical protein [Bacteroidota bacterium]